MKNICLRVSDEIARFIQEVGEGNNNSEKMRDILTSHYLNNEMLELKKKKLLSKLNIIDRQLKANIISKYCEMPKEEKEWLKELVEKLEKNPQWLAGNYDAYKNLFGRRLTLNDFRIKLQQIKDGV